MFESWLQNPFAFSTFSALSELVVTALVLYVIFTSLRGGPLRWRLLAVTLTFELLVNVAYMVQRTVVVAVHHPNPLGEWLGVLGAFHGLLSLVMFLGLIAISILAYRAERRGESFFRRRRGLTWTFVVLWLVSVLSGEVIYLAVWRPFF